MTYITLLTLSASIMCGLAYYCWQRRAVPGGRAFAMALFLGGVWMLSIAVMLGRQDSESALFWYRVSLMPVAVMPVLLLSFALEYIGRNRWAFPSRQTFLYIIPFITMCLVWTDARHHLFFKTISVFMKNDLMVINHWSPGPWFVIHSVYSFSLVFIALAILWTVAIKQFSIYRYQSVMIIAGTLAIILPNLGFAVGLIPPDVILLPFGFLAMGIILTWSIFRHGLFDIVPVARNTLLDIMSDGMVVLDGQNRIVDLNPAALHTIDVKADDAIGRTAEEIFDRFPGVVDHILTMSPGQTEFSITRGKTTTHFDVRISMLLDKNGLAAGRLILFRDITDRKNVEGALLEERDKLQDAISEIKQLSGLLPICASCKKIRDDKGYWNKIETYIHDHSEAKFSHGICPECMDEMYGEQDWYKKRKKTKQ